MEENGSKYHGNARTEEVGDIIDRMPTRFGLWVTLIVLFVFILLFVFGWLVRYPDVISGQITVNANESPIKLIANANGKLGLAGLRSMENVSEGQIIGYLKNPAELSSVLEIDSILRGFDPSLGRPDQLLSGLPSKPSLGELNGRYNAFVNSISELDNYNADRLFDKQIEDLSLLLSDQNKSIEISSNRMEMNRENLDYIKKFYRRDSILFAKKVISESDLDKMQISYFGSKDAYQNSISTLVGNRQQAHQTSGRIREISVQKSEKLKALKIAVVASYNDLVDNIKSWEQKYVFRSPFDGRVQFLKFWVNDQFIAAGEQVFTVIPKTNKVMGQVAISTRGAGKVILGQEVIVKLDNFPYNEYGSIKGFVKTIGLSTNLIKTENGDVESYMVTVEFPNQLRTNYGAVLDAKLEAKGSAEIITKDRRLIERFFDNLRYSLIK